MRPIFLFFIAPILLLCGCATIQGSLFDMGLASERLQSGLERHTIEIDERAIHYLERDGAGPQTQTLVLVHGFAGDKDHWLWFARVLPPVYRVLALDLPGHDDNVRDTSVTYSITYLTHVLSDFIDEVDVGPVHVVGNSLGGRIAVEMALSWPDRIESVSLLDPAGIRSPEPSQLDAALARGENLLIPTTRTKYDKLILISFGKDAPDLPWPTASVLSRRYSERAPLYRKIWVDIGAEANTLETRLHQLAPPLLVVWGEQDGVIDVSAAGRWADLVPEVQIEIMAGVGHAPMLEQPEETMRIVDNFIRRTR